MLVVFLSLWQNATWRKIYLLSGHWVQNDVDSTLESTSLADANFSSLCEESHRWYIDLGLLQYPPATLTMRCRKASSASRHWIDDKKYEFAGIELWGTDTLNGSCGPSFTWRTYNQTMDLLRISLSSVVAIHFRASVQYLYLLWRVAQCAELRVTLLPGFLKWEIEEEVTLMTFFLPEGSIKW